MNEPHWILAESAQPHWVLFGLVGLVALTLGAAVFAMASWVELRRPAWRALPTVPRWQGLVLGAGVSVVVILVAWFALSPGFDRAWVQDGSLFVQYSPFDRQVRLGPVETLTLGQSFDGRMYRILVSTPEGNTHQSVRLFHRNFEEASRRLRGLQRSGARSIPGVDSARPSNAP